LQTLSLTGATKRTEEGKSRRPRGKSGPEIHRDSGKEELNKNVERGGCPKRRGLAFIGKKISKHDRSKREEGYGGHSLPSLRETRGGRSVAPSNKGRR